MKYLVFSLFALLAVPISALLATRSERSRSLLVIGLVFSPFLGDLASINFLSLENYRGPDRGFEVTLTDLLALGLGISLLLRDRRHLRWVPPGSLLMALLLGLCLVSFLSSSSPLLGSFTLFKAMRFYLVYWVVSNALVCGTPVRVLHTAFISVAIGSVLVALFQKYGQGIYRIPLLFDHSNTVPLYLNLILPVILLLGAAREREEPKALLVSMLAALGIAFAVLSTFSRAGIALTAVSMVAALAWALGRVRAPRLIGAAAVVAVLGLGGAVKGADSVLERIRLAPESSADARDEFNVAAELMVADRALGVGPNNFSHALTSTDHYRQHFKVMSNETEGGVVHHIYWLTAAEFGWLGLLLFLAILLRFLADATRFALRRRGELALALGGAAIGFLAIHLAGFLEWGLRITPVVYQFAFVAGLTAGGSELLRRGTVASVPVDSPVPLQGMG